MASLDIKAEEKASKMGLNRDRNEHSPSKGSFRKKVRSKKKD